MDFKIRPSLYGPSTVTLGRNLRPRPLLALQAIQFYAIFGGTVTKRCDFRPFNFQDYQYCCIYCKSELLNLFLFSDINAEKPDKPQTKFNKCLANRGFGYDVIRCANWQRNGEMNSPQNDGKFFINKFYPNFTPF